MTTWTKVTGDFDFLNGYFDVRHRTLKLAFDHGHRRPVAALGFRFADADDGREAGAVGSECLCVDKGIGFAVIDPTL